MPNQHSKEMMDFIKQHTFVTKRNLFIYFTAVFATVVILTSVIKIVSTDMHITSVQKKVNSQAKYDNLVKYLNDHECVREGFTRTATQEPLGIYRCNGVIYLFSELEIMAKNPTTMAVEDGIPPRSTFPEEYH